MQPCFPAWCITGDAANRAWVSCIPGQACSLHACPAMHPTRAASAVSPGKRQAEASTDAMELCLLTSPADEEGLVKCPQPPPNMQSELRHGRLQARFTCPEASTFAMLWQGLCATLLHECCKRILGWELLRTLLNGTRCCPATMPQDAYCAGARRSWHFSHA